MDSPGNLLSENKDLQKAIYEDIGQSAAKKFGVALGDITDWLTLWRYHFRLRSEKKRLLFEKNIREFSKELDEIPQEKVVEMIPEISEPVFERLTYTTNEDIAKLYIGLLTKASNEDTASMAHPAFIDIIGRLSSDEAKIINYLKDVSQVPFSSIHLQIKNTFGGGFREIYKRLTGVEDYAKVEYPDNINAYFDNLLRLGILEFTPGNYLTDKNRYDKIRELYNEHMKAAEEVPERNEIFSSATWEDGYYVVTNFGSLFIKACTKSKSPAT